MDILIAMGILGGLGLAFGLVLAIASKVFYVKEDPRLAQLSECLPGANCGGCGYAGCGGYAEAVLKGDAPIGKCASGGSECAQRMAQIMGVKAEPVARRVALVRCSGGKKFDENGVQVAGAKMKGTYEGIEDCLAASKVAGRGPLACKFGCLGFGNCVAACKYGALSVVDGVAKVDQEKCVGHGLRCRVPQRADRAHGVRQGHRHRLCVQRQGCRHQPSMLLRLHRRRAVREDLPSGRHQGGGQSCRHRL